MNIKHSIMILELLISGVSMAATLPASECPNGYFRYQVFGLSIYTEEGTHSYHQCPDSSNKPVIHSVMEPVEPNATTLFPFFNSCIKDTSLPDCWLYAPANFDFSDTTGTYQFAENCNPT